MSTDVNEELEEVVDQLARRHARRWWWADREELRQVAWVGALCAKKKLDPKKPKASVKSFVRVNIAYHLSCYLTANTSPVSAANHDRYKLIGLARAPIDALADREAEEDAEMSLEVERWRAKVIVTLRRVVKDERVLESLLTGERPTPEALRAIGRILDCPELRELLNERTQR